MGHKVNPLVFRLGSSNQWLYNFKQKKNWITSYLIYQLVSNQFLRYTTPHFHLAKTRNKRNDQGLVRMRGEKQIVSNSLIKRSILFSHVVTGSYLSNLIINCFFYDYGISLYCKKKKVKKFAKYNQLFANQFLRRYKRHPYWRKHIKFRGYPKFFYKWIYHMGQNFWLYNNKYLTIAKAKNAVNFTAILCWLRLSKKLHKFTKKKRIFFLTIFLNQLLSISPILKTAGYQYLTRRIFLVISLLNLVTFSFKLNNSWFFSKQFRARYYLFKSLSKTMSNSVNQMRPDQFKSITIKYNAIREKKMTSSLLTNLISIKLGQYFRINSILYPLTRWLKRHRDVFGYRIMISGRLTRRERASHMIKSYKSMPLSSYKHRIDYHQDVKIMKFGMVGIKVYLFLRKKNRNPYYFFKFKKIIID